MATSSRPPSSLLSPVGEAAGGSLLLRWLIGLWPLGSQRFPGGLAEVGQFPVVPALHGPWGQARGWQLGKGLPAPEHPVRAQVWPTGGWMCPGWPC